MQEDLIEQKIIVISEEPEIPPKIPTKTKTSRNSKTVKTTQATKNPKAVYTGKSLSEALILASNNPRYDGRLLIELQVQYMKIPSSEHGENMLCTEIVLDVQNNLCAQHVLPMFFKK